jgi:CHAT domain-containing protein
VYTGVAVLGQNRINKAEAMFESVEAAAPARYAALHGYIQWQRATCLMTRARWGGTIELLTHAIEEFERLRESNNAAYLHDILSQCYGIVGDRNRASRHRAIALRGLGNVTSYRLGHAVSGLVYDATQAKDWRAALSFVALEHHIAQRVGDQELLTEALVRRALLHARFGDQAAAGADLREAAAVVASVEDPTLHEKLTNDRNAAAALISTDPRTAIPMLTELLRFNETKGWRALIPGFYLRRGRMYRAIGDPRRAAADFEAGIAELEMHRESLPVGEERWGVLDAADELFDEATESALHTRPADAFAYAERERARSISDTLPAATSPAEAKPFDFASLPADAAIIEYAVLPDRLIVFAVDRSGCRAEERVIAREDLSEVLRSFTYAAQNGKRDTRAFDVLIAPVRDVVATHRELVFVPDAATALVPFAALSESRPLVEQHTIVVAPSARFFVQARSRESGSPRRSVLIVDNPSTETMASLSFASSEAAAIAREYAETRRLSGPEATTAAFLEKAREAAAIHFAGHGIVSGDSAALMLASGAADAATLSRGSVSGVVVLAACDTARGPVHAAEGVISVAHAFLQAGAPTVIATLWPIADEDAADFFPRLHRHLARGLPPAEALRLAQLEFMRDPRNERSTLWAAVQAIGN